MSETSANKSAVEKVAAAWSAGTGDIFDVVSKDVVWTVVASGDAGRTYHGLEAFFAGAFGPLRDRYASRMHPEIRGVYADGDVVVLRWNGAADLVDGQTYRNRYVFVFTMRDGLAVRVEEFCDIATYEAAKAGAAMPAWEAQT